MSSCFSTNVGLFGCKWDFHHISAPTLIHRNHREQKQTAHGPESLCSLWLCFFNTLTDAFNLMTSEINEMLKELKLSLLLPAVGRSYSSAASDSCARVCTTAVTVLMIINDSRRGKSMDQSLSAAGFHHSWDVFISLLVNQKSSVLLVFMNVP